MDAQPATELARAILAQVAPGELPLFGPISRAYAADPGRARMRRGGDETLGFGLAEAAPLLTPVVLAVAEQVVRYLADDLSKSLTHTAGDFIAQRIARLFRHEAGTQPLTPAQLSHVRTIAVEVARDADVPEAQSSLLADALIGQLAVKPVSP
jgi:hypothetical protein